MLTTNPNPNLRYASSTDTKKFQSSNVQIPEKYAYCINKHFNHDTREALEKIPTSLRKKVQLWFTKKEIQVEFPLNQTVTKNGNLNYSAIQPQKFDDNLGILAVEQQSIGNINAPMSKGYRLLIKRVIDPINKAIPHITFEHSNNRQLHLESTSIALRRYTETPEIYERLYGKKGKIDLLAVVQQRGKIELRLDGTDINETIARIEKLVPAFPIRIFINSETQHYVNKEKSRIIITDTKIIKRVSASFLRFLNKQAFLEN